MTTGTLLTDILERAIDSAGLAMAGAKLQFYLTGTTTPTNVYTTVACTVAHANPVVADSGGLFAPIYLDPAVTYRCQLKTSGGSVILDIDPLTSTFTPGAGSITNAMLAAGVAVANLGYTPVNKAGDTATDLKVAFGAALTTDNAGYLGMPVNTHDADVTFALTDAGHLQRHTDATARAWTIPANATVAFPIGTVLPFRNVGTGVVTLTRAGGVTLRIAGASTDQNVAVAQWGMGALVKEDTNTWVASGTGLS